MKRFALFCGIVMLAASLALAQEAAPKPEPKPAPKADVALPTVEQILDKYVTALGGKEALQKLTSVTLKGTFDLPAMGATGTMESQMQAPNKSYMKIEIGGFGAIVQAYDGKVGWSQDPISGLRELGGAELAAIKIEADFYKDIRLKELYKKLAVKGKEKIASGEAYVIEATPAEGDLEKYYFDVTTNLLVRHDAEREGPQGKMATEYVYEDYKVVNGVKMLHTVKQTNPAFSATIKVTEVKHNVPVDAAKFTKPAQ